MDTSTPQAADAGQTAAPALTHPWLAHYSPGVPHEITIPDASLPAMLDAAARQYGTRDAVIYYGTRISYVQLIALVDRFAQALVKLGIQRGDRVAVDLPNVPQFPVAFYGALKAGAIVVPTNPLYTGPELRHQLRDSSARALVILDQFYPTFAEVRAETPVEHIIVCGVADYLPPVLALAYPLKEAREQRGKPKPDWKALRADPAVHRYTDLLGTAHDRHGFEVFALPEPAAPDDLAVLQYTGGTTGVAKGAMLSHRNLVANAMQAHAWSEQAPGSPNTCLCVAPFFHSYGLTVGMNASLLFGAGLVLLPRFSAADCVTAIQKYKPALFPGVPTMYLAITRAVEEKKKRADLSSVKVCISGAAPLPGEVQARFERLSGAKLVEGYGLTEASPVTHCNPVFGERRLGTIGLPMPGTDSAIINAETGDFLPRGEIGEIVVRGPQVMQGYWQRPDETAKVIQHGWLRTGDIGVMEPDGYFRVVDRAKDLIIAGGYNIYPRDVEEVLFQHPKVLEAVVIGVPDAYRGETVRAYVVPRPGEHLTEQELDAFCRARLAAYKVPKQYAFRDSLPKTLIGKVLRRALREEAQREGTAGPPNVPPATHRPGED
jgi:long-chain acyl-CoA synthetase